VWEFRRDLISQSGFIDSLVEEWETTSVEFKRELILETADQKAKFIKEVISLANTQASGRRWLIAGFDDNTREFYKPVPAKIDQDRIQDLVSQYIRPSLEVRYKTVDYKGRGEVGLLEILRKARALPYSATQSLGEKKKGGEQILKEGQIFVRHGSLIREASPEEVETLRQEAEWAKNH
jgi:hypothetical protein